MSAQGINLDLSAPPNLAGTKVGDTTVETGTSIPEFGYVVMDRDGTASWSIVVHAPDGGIRRKCRLEDRRLSCQA